MSTTLILSSICFLLVSASPENDSDIGRSKRVRFSPMQADDELIILDWLRELKENEIVDSHDIWRRLVDDPRRSDSGGFVEYQALLKFIKRVIGVRNLSIPTFMASIASPLARKEILEKRLGALEVRIINKVVSERTPEIRASKRLSQEEFSRIIDTRMKCT